MSKKALEGIRVLDFTTMAAGPTAILIYLQDNELSLLKQI